MRLAVIFARRHLNRSSALGTVRHLSSSTARMVQEPKVVSREDLPVNEAKWVTLKKITWIDQDGKEVWYTLCQEVLVQHLLSPNPFSVPGKSRRGRLDPKAASTVRNPLSNSECPLSLFSSAVAILALLYSKKSGSKPSTIIIEQYRPPIEKYVIELPAGLRSLCVDDLPVLTDR